MVNICEKLLLFKTVLSIATKLKSVNNTEIIDIHSDEYFMGEALRLAY